MKNGERANRKASESESQIRKNWGFESEANLRMLAQEKVFNGLCPKNPNELASGMKNDEAFRGAMSRCAQTEGRVGILKNVFLNGSGATP